jgi:glutamyl/glutaminyl-tRNA synthetase
MTVRTRFAPSPTGSLHVGGVRTALYCLLYARKHKGTFILRIEDTDRARSTDESTAGILRDLRWLGLDWDEGPGKDGGVGPYFQSQRLELYGGYLANLEGEERAYLAWESREELGAMRTEAMKNKRGFRYARRHYTAEDLERFQTEERTPVLRFSAPKHDIIVRDHILGDVKLGEQDQDDFVIRKTDGFPTYHFAVVIDDHHMKITHILRGQEHLMNTPKHIGLYEALGWTSPEVGHLPLIFNTKGSKMSKRDKAKTAREVARTAAKERGLTGKGWDWLAAMTSLDADDLTGFMKKKHDTISTAEAIAEALDATLPMIEVMDFRVGGYLPEALVNYMALLGWSPGDDREVMSIAEMVEAFSLERVNNTAARFDPAKLRWMNSEYMRSLPMERLQACFQQYLDVVDSPYGSLDTATRAIYLNLFRERAATFAELDEASRFLFVRPAHWAPKAVKKHLLKGGGSERLLACREALSNVKDWEAPALEAAVTALLSDEQPNLGKFAQPIRIAVCGGPVSPSIFETLELLSQEEVLQRLDNCIAHVSARG